jgi:hypothetical protein
MNDRFGSFDLDSFGTGFAASTAAATSQQQQQHQQLYNSITGSNNNNGPLMEGYDPAVLLGNSGAASNAYTSNPVPGQQQQHPHGASLRNTSSHHQTLMPSTATATTTTTTIVGFAIAPPRRLGTSTIGGNNGGAATTADLSGMNGSRGNSNSGGSFPDFDSFDPIPLSKSIGRRPHPPQQQGQQQTQQQRHLRRNINHLQLNPQGSTAASSVGSSMAAMASIQQHRSLNQSRHLASQHHQLRPELAGAGLSDLFAPPSYGGNCSSTAPTNYNNCHRSSSNPEESWLEELRVTVSGLSLEPLSGTEIVKRLNQRTTEVLSRYLPCVEFLVECQQDLRKGLAAATTQRFVHHMFRDAMTARQFYNTYISNLPERFYRTNRRVMGEENLQDAFKELQKLCANARAAESQGSEVVKNTFLGGMKDGESWGLRKWLSKHGGALQICNDTECILNSCQKLDRSSQSTIKLAARLRPMAQAALDKLKGEVPSSYQEQSSAHPYLPFFHRLESALRGMTNFDPEDDDVICIDDDDEVEELRGKVAPPPSKNPPKAVDDGGGGSESSTDGGRGKRKAASISKSSDDENCNDNDSDSDIEVLDSKPFARASNKPGSNNSTDGSVCEMMALNGDDSDYMTLLRTLEDGADDEVNIDFDELEKKSNLFANSSNAHHLAAAIDQLAALFESNQHSLLRPQYLDESESFWDETPRYADALRLLSNMLRAPESASMFLERINEVELVHEGKLPYGSIIKHPLCFRDIVAALVEDFNVDSCNVVSNTGTLPVPSLSSWNMWHGSELLQAIDLIFLNSLAYGKANDRSNKSAERSKTNKLRKALWAGIKDVIDDYAAPDVESRRRCTPTRRGESSGFVVHKGAI